MLAAIALGATAAPAGSAPECYGAAARDPARPCDNPALRLQAKPHPLDAQLEPGLRCRVLTRKPLRVCAFGTSRRRATGDFVLLGDSHGPAWRAAVDVLARRRRWRGLDLFRASCPFAFAARLYVDEAPCVEWVRAVGRWLQRRPKVRTVFLVNSVAYRWAAADGEDPHANAVAGYRRALDSLPPSVRNVVVIRDNPKFRHDTLECVQRALRDREPPGDRCAIPRDEALPPDPAAEAATQLAAGRGRAIDLSPHFCDDQRCYPVVGGVLAFKDSNHITTLFGRTLGPYLVRAYRALALSGR